MTPQNSLACPLKGILQASETIGFNKNISLDFVELYCTTKVHFSILVAKFQPAKND
jgi:hypothetical protein